MCTVQLEDLGVDILAWLEELVDKLNLLPRNEAVVMRVCDEEVLDRCFPLVLIFVQWLLGRTSLAKLGSGHCVSRDVSVVGVGPVDCFEIVDAGKPDDRLWTVKALVLKFKQCEQGEGGADTVAGQYVVRTDFLVVSLEMFQGRQDIRKMVWVLCIVQSVWGRL